MGLGGINESSATFDRVTFATRAPPFFCCWPGEITAKSPTRMIRASHFCTLASQRLARDVLAFSAQQ
jgi:hypothetical protein